jgi:uncharacterized protein YndB with AHSA1/START domain
MNDSRNGDASLVIECDLPDPPEKVWRALTEPELVAQWLAPERGESIDCELIGAEPNRFVRYSWCDRDDDALEGGIDSIVTFVLAPTEGGGTHLRIVHTGFEQRPAMAMAA